MSAPAGIAAAEAARRDRLLGHGAMLLFAALIAMSFSLGKRASAHIDPGALTTLRFALGTLVMGLLAAPAMRAAHFAAPWRFAVIGALFAAYFLLMFEGLRLTDPVPLAAVFTLIPAMSAVFGWWLLGQVTTARMAVALALGGAGALWVIFRGDTARMLALQIGPGEGLYFLGCVAHALYTPMLAKLNRGEPALVFGAGALAGGLAVSAAWSARAVAATDWTALPPIVWGAALYLGLVATAGTFLLMRFAALRLPSAKVLAYGYLVPSFVILYEGLLGEGWVAGPVWVGVGATVAALALLLREER